MGKTLNTAETSYGPVRKLLIFRPMCCRGSNTLRWRLQLVMYATLDYVASLIVTIWTKRASIRLVGCLFGWSTHSMPFPVCSFLSSQTVLPEHEHTVLSLSQTPALLAITPTRVSGSSLLKAPSWCLATTMLLPIISQI